MIGRRRRYFSYDLRPLTYELNGGCVRISYNWLKDYVDLKLPAEKLAQVLTMAGMAVNSVEEKADDYILEIEITSNRPDWLSYIGVAREIAAITGKRLKVPKIKKLRTTKYERRTTIKVEDRKLCPRYTARVIRNVNVGESPGWLKKRIESTGLRSVNNIVDITNFCLFETGEPMHAFDLDNISGGAVIIRKAEKNEKITVIDGTLKALDESMLVIADAKGPIAIAGVMGGLKAEVGMSTKNILLEAAYFDPISVRRTSRRLSLSTESSYRFERKVDMDNIEYASDRATQLILEIAGGEAHDRIDIGNIEKKKRKVELRADRLNKILGVEISSLKAKNILTSLGLKAAGSQGKGVLKTEIPDFRQDLQDEIDLIEEVARIYGYDNITETLPPVVEKEERLPLDVIVDNKIRETLKGLGLSEIITYGLLSRRELSLAKIDDKDVIAIKNPLSAEQEIMRPSSIAGMLGAIRYNINRKNNNLKLFELGKVYFKEGANSFKETRNLTIGLAGEIYDGWITDARTATLFDLKGILETLFLNLGISVFSLKEAVNDTFSPAVRASIEAGGKILGIIGEINSGVSKNFDIKGKVYMLEIDCEALFGLVSLEKYFSEPARYPSVSRDISIVVDNNTSNDNIISSITASAGELLKKVRLIDRYRGGQIPDGKTSLTYRLEYQDISRTLEDKEIQDAHSRVVRALQENLGASLR